MTLVEVPPDRWDPLLEELGCADAYLRRGYVEASCVVDGGRARLLHLSEASGDVVFALSLRSIPGSELVDVTTPYGYGGPVGVGRDPPVDRFWRAYAEWCAENRVVSTFLRFHPLFENQRDAGPDTRLEPRARTVAWNLLPGRDPFESMHRHHRRVVRKAAERVSVRVVEAPDSLDGFARLYDAAMARLGAGSFYRFPAPYWATLVTGFRACLVRFTASVDGEVAAESLCLATPPWLHYHLGATVEAARSTGASHLVMLEAARWAQARGYEIFHLGGGRGGRDDSLLEYKVRFAPDDTVGAWVGKAVNDREAYRALSGRAGPDEGFFPAYRARASANIAPAAARS